MYFLLKTKDIAIKNSQVNMTHDIEVAGQYLV